MIYGEKKTAVVMQQLKIVVKKSGTSAVKTRDSKL